MPVSAVARGQYFKRRTKRWLEAQGYVVAYLERMLSVPTAQGFAHVKQDQLGADLIAQSTAGTRYVQVKGGATWRSQLSAARKEFAKYPLGLGDEQVIVGWSPRAREPEIEVVRVGPCAAHQAIRRVPRRRPKVLPLFSAERMTTCSRSR